MPTQTHIEQLEAMTNELGLNGVLLQLSELCDIRANELMDSGDETDAESWAEAGGIISHAADLLLEEGGDDS